jgi:chromosome segregation ATPase
MQNQAPINNNQTNNTEKSTVEKLADKVSLAVEKYNEVTAKNATLTEELAAAKAKIEAKDKEILELTEQNEMKELEIEEIVSKIESILG